MHTCEPDAVWFYPFGVRAKGRDAITAEWLSEQHVYSPGRYDARFELIAIDSDVVVAHGRVRFVDPRTDGCFTGPS